MKKLFILSAILLSVLSCKNKEAEPETPVGPTQMEQVVAIHDDLMPQMSTIGEMIAKLEATVDSTQMDSMKINSIADLKSANQSMMTWMKDFGSTFSSDEIMKGAELSEEKKAALNEFELSVHALKAEMQMAIENAKSLLDLE